MIHFRLLINRQACSRHHLFSQSRIGSQLTMITVTMLSRPWHQHRQAIQKLFRFEVQLGLTIGQGFRQLIAQTLTLVLPT